MIRKALLCVLIAALSVSASAQTPPTPEGEALLVQMREMAKKQGMTLTPEMEAMALQRMRETQANILGLQMAAQNDRNTVSIASLAPVTPAAPAAHAAQSPPATEGASLPTTPPASDEVSSMWTFIAPPDNDPRVGGFACGIRFGMEQYGNSVDGSRYARLERTGPTTATMTTFAGSQDLAIGKGVRIGLAVAEVRDDQQCAVTFDVLAAERFVKGKFLNLHKPPSFTAADVLVQTNKFFYRSIFSSSYPADALMANFDRLGVKECLNVGVPYSRQIPRDMRGQGANLYCIRVDGQNIPVVTECHPYRDGTQCTTLAVLTAIRQGRTFDARESAKSLRAAVESILAD